ncbi:MAG: sugar-transfer associated ATP-grasp domain-containing protein [Myxococcota bacterium]
MQLANDLRAARRLYEANYAQLVWRAARLYARRGFGPGEALKCGLLDPDIPANIEAGCIPKRRLEAHQLHFNPTSSECLTEDKSVFYTYCRALGLPVPELYAVFDTPCGWTRAGVTVRSREEWERFFREELPEEFVVKPAAGVFGWGVGAFRRAGGGFVGASGKRHTAASLYKMMVKHSTYRRFVLQERVHNHSELQRLSGAAGLQTVRLVSWIGREGEVSLYNPELKIIVGDRLTDNFQGGRTGNLIANVSFDGVLGPAIGGTPDGIGLRKVEEHPSTRVTFSGFVIPHWEEACALVRRAARLFAPLRTIGWDVAITATGPVLIEGNMWWDPGNELIVGQRAVHTSEGMQQLFERFAAETP